MRDAEPRVVTRTFLELPSLSLLQPAAHPGGDVRMAPAPDCTPSFYRYLYAEVGKGWEWRDRSDWSDGRLRAHLSRGAITIHVLWSGGTPAGFIELERHEDGSTEIVYFGLLPEFHGRGFGKFLLTEAARTAWCDAPTRVWLHTCTLDSPRALPNYLARGFVRVREERYTVPATPASS